jgi:hypothetical protein
MILSPETGTQLLPEAIQPKRQSAALVFDRASPVNGCACRATFSKIFGRDFGAEDQLARLRRNAVDMVVRFATRSENLVE